MLLWHLQPYDLVLYSAFAVYSQIMITSHTSQEGLGLLAGGPREIAQEQFHTLIPIFQ